MRLIDADELLKKVESINSCNYGSMFSWKAHSAASEVLRDIIQLIEITPTIKIAESLLPPIEEMRDFTPEESAAYNKHIEEISTSIIGVDGKPVNLMDMLGD